MKIFWFALSVLIPSTTFGQNTLNTPAPVIIDFERLDDTMYAKLEINTTNPNNIWQVGKPQKALLNMAYNGYNVIITDTINPYSTNDTSSFIIKCNPDIGVIAGYYYCDTDSLNDYGLIEVSVDNGQTWTNPLVDSSNVQNIIQNFGTIPVLTGSSNGWQYFDITPFLSTNIYWLRFTFISDSVDTGHEGLMFDYLVVGALTTNTKQIHQLNNLKVFPNPTNNYLNFQFTEPVSNAEIRIYSSIGQLMTTQNITNTDVQFDVSDWNSGVYFYGVYIEGEVVKQGQILVEHR